MTPEDDLRSKLANAEPRDLVAFLARLAEESDALRERIEALALRADPSALASSLERRLDRFRNERSFISYGESSGFARELDGWLDDVEAGLLATDPAAAWRLIDRFIRTDERIIGRADDSNGSIGDTYRRACGLWHRAAAALPADPAWVERVYNLHAGNGYGTRDALLDTAATRLSGPELRHLARIYERQAESAAGEDEKSYQALAARAALGQVACALGDAALYERSVCIHSQHPSELQAAEIAKQYLRFGPVERAVEWLTRSEGRSGRGGDERLDLLAQAYERLGNREALLDARRRLAESSLSAGLFAQYAALLPPEEKGTERQRALERAKRNDEPVGAGLFLLELGEADEASVIVLRLCDRLGAAYYDRLLSLARHFEKAARPLPAVACYRALTEQILGEARSNAYRHAKRYVDRLAALHSSVPDYGELPGHTEYLAQLRKRHGRKLAFWRLFEGETV